MMVPQASTPPLAEQGLMAGQGGLADWTDLERRLAPSGERAEPRQRAMAYRRGLLSPAERQHSWQVAEVTGDATPSGVQHLRRRALGDPDAVRAELRRYVIQHLGDPEAVVVLDETGLLQQGRHSAGVARQYRGTAGHVEHCPSGVLVGYARRLGQTWLDRELYLPTEWTNERERCRQAGIPEEQRVATKPQLAQQLLARAFAAGVPAPWVTGDSGYGDDRRLRLWLEAHPQASVLAVSGQESVGLGFQQRRVQTILAALPEDGWTRRRAGDGTKGPRWDDRPWLPLAEPLEPGWRRWLRVRRRVSTPTEVTGYVVFARHDATLEDGVRGAGTRWTTESGFEAAKSEVGLDHCEVRSWTGWSRHITLAMWALALLTVLRAGASAVEAFKKSLLPPQAVSPLAAFKASRGPTFR